MPSHDAVVQAVERVCERAEMEDVKTLYLAGAQGVPDGNIHLAITEGVRRVYTTDVLHAWGRRP